MPFKQVAVGKAGLDAVACCGGPPVQAEVDLTSRGQNKDEQECNTPEEGSVRAPTSIHCSRCFVLKIFIAEFYFYINQH